MFGKKKRIRMGLAVLCVSVVASCSPSFKSHGYAPAEEDLLELVVGVDDRATVDDTVGAPSASGVLAGGDYYYIRSRIRTFGPLRPEVVERNIVAISFDDSDTIQNIERFTLKDGQLVPISRRVTDASVFENGFLRQILGNLGNIDPSTFLN